MDLPLVGVLSFILDTFLIVDLDLDIIIPKPGVSVDETLTWLGNPGGCIGGFLDRVFLHSQRLQIA